MLPHIMGSAWCNLNFKPLLLFGFKSVLRTGESEGEGKLARKEWGGGRGESQAAQTSAPLTPIFLIQWKQLHLTSPTYLRRHETLFLEVAFRGTFCCRCWLVGWLVALRVL